MCVLGFRLANVNPIIAVVVVASHYGTLKLKLELITKGARERSYTSPQRGGHIVDVVVVVVINCGRLDLQITAKRAWFALKLWFVYNIHFMCMHVVYL